MSKARPAALAEGRWFGDFDPLSAARPQPLEHLIRVLRDMGHSRDATMVAIEKQRALRRAGHIGNRTTRQRFAVFWHRSPQLLALRRIVNRAATKVGNAATRWMHDAYGVAAGFGYRLGQSYRRFRVRGWTSTARM